MANEQGATGGVGDQGAPSAEAGTSGPGSVHCPYRRATDLLQRLTPGKMRIGFLIGAGCPLAIQVPDGEKAKALIPEIAGLTKLVKAHLDGSEELQKQQKQLGIVSLGGESAFRP